jgi:DNA-binding HxlR family transcriptional regulator
LIVRTVYQEVPPRVKYSLAELGLTLKPLLIELKSWGETYAPHYLAELATPALHQFEE